MNGDPYNIKPGYVRRVVGYHKFCGRCKSVLALRLGQVNFNGVTAVTCPVCQLTVKFTGDDGFIYPDVKTVYANDIKKVGNGTEEENECGQTEGND